MLHILTRAQDTVLSQAEVLVQVNQVNVMAGRKISPLKHDELTIYSLRHSVVSYNYMCL